MYVTSLKCATTLVGPTPVKGNYHTTRNKNNLEI